QRHRQHDGAEGVQGGAAVAAVLGRVDDHRHRGVARAGGQQVDDHEVVDHAREDEDGAGEDGRGEQRDHDPAHDLELAGAQVGGASSYWRPRVTRRAWTTIAGQETFRVTRPSTWLRQYLSGG